MDNLTEISPVLLTERGSGGAGTATRRIHEALREIGLNSQMVVGQKSNNDPTIHEPDTKLGKAFALARPQIDSLPLIPYDTEGVYSVNWIPDNLDKRVQQYNPDIIHFNWMGNGFLNVGSLDKFEQPIVWRLPDMWPFTGGCHYTSGCERYQDTCGKCPKLHSNRSIDPSRINLKRKKRSVEKSDVTVVATTPWLAEKAKDSAVFQDARIEIIPNALNTDIFRPHDPSIGRDLFDLPADKPLILFGALNPLSDERKGFDLLTNSLRRISEQYEGDAEIVVFGTKKSEEAFQTAFPTHYVGYLHDEVSLALLYAAADLMVVPSRYEAFGQTVSESMACGTPVVAFDSSGPADIIEHDRTGYLASSFDPKELAYWIETLLKDTHKRELMGNQSREVAVKEFEYGTIADEYLKLYLSLV